MMGRMRIFYKSSLKGISMDKNSTTIYKGIAILAIMMCHAAGYFGGGNITYFTPLGGIGVAIFFLLSAYGLNESWNKRIMSAAAKGEKMKKIEPCSTYTGGGYRAVLLLVAKTIYHSVDSIYYPTADYLLAIP